MTRGYVVAIAILAAAGLAMAEVEQAGTHLPGPTGTARAVAETAFPPSETGLVACPPVITEYDGAFGFDDVACGVSRRQAFAFRKAVDEALSRGGPGHGPVSAITSWGEVGRNQTRAFRIGDHAVVGTDQLTNPVRKSSRSPIYPVAVRRKGIEARVALAALIEADGSVSHIQVIASSVPGFGFEESAMNAVRSWRYEPGTLNGGPVPVLFTISVDYSIEP